MAVIQNAEMKNRKWLMGTIYFVLIIGLLISFFPIIWLFLGTFKTNTELTAAIPTLLPEAWSFDNYRQAFEKYDLGANILNTIFFCFAMHYCRFLSRCKRHNLKCCHLRHLQRIQVFFRLRLYFPAPRMCICCRHF